MGKRSEVKKRYRAARSAAYDSVSVAHTLGAAPVEQLYPLFKSELARHGYTSSIRPKQFRVGFDWWVNNQSGDSK